MATARLMLLRVPYEIVISSRSPLAGLSLTRAAQHPTMREVAVWAVGGFGEFVAVVEWAVFAAIQQARNRVDGENSFEAAAAEALDGLFAEDIDML